MPGLICVPDFVREVREDFNSPTTSNFVSRIPQCKDTVNKLEETLSRDKEGLVKLKNAVKEICKAGNNHATSELELSKALNSLGEAAIVRDDEPDDIGAAFQKFAVVTKEMSNLMKNLMQNLDSIVMFPVDRLLKTELRGSKGDLKRPFDRSWKDYQEKFSELERQKKKAAKEAGLHRSDLTAGEIADEMDKERKYLQLTTAEYLLRINEIRTKKGVNLLQQMLEYYRAQCKYFSDGLQTIEHFGNYVEDLNAKLGLIQQEHEEERKALIDVRNTLKNSPGICKVKYEKYLHEAMMSSTFQMVTKMRGGGRRLLREDSSCPPPRPYSENGTNTLGYTLHPEKGDASLGNLKSGYLNKRSEGRLRNVWQKRKCQIREGFLEIYHADESKAPTQVNLLTCQMKSVGEDLACFDVVSYNRTYHFQAENEKEKKDWMSVLLNSKDGALKQAFQDNGKASSSANQGFIELQRTLVSYIRSLPSNDKCCDCGSNNDATWLSVNFGVIVCIECSGIHREMGVHISKIQSLTLDNIGTSQLLVAKVMTNEGFNKVMEAKCPVKLNPNSTMVERKSFIKAKYEEKKFVQPLCSSSQELFADLEQAIDAHSISDLLQSFGEAGAFGVDITDPLPTSEFAETSLHHAISHETGHSLHMVDFLVQNSSSLDRQTREGNTPLHYCVIQNQCESMRLLLRSGANPAVENNNGKTPLDIAKERGHRLCEEMLLHALQRKKTMFDNVNIDWHLSHDEGSTDFSDDETLDDHPRLNGSRTPENALLSSPDKDSAGSGRHVRPLSVFTPNSSRTPLPLMPNSAGGKQPDWDWARTTPSDSGDSPGSGRNNSMPPPPPPQGKKPSIFSSSNLASHMVGSLKKGSKQSMSLPSSSIASAAYNTLPAAHHLRTSTSSPRFIANHHNHKRSPSSDSGHGTLHNPMLVGSSSSRSNTPVSYHGGKIHHTVYLHVGPQSGGGGGGSSDTSPPLKGFSEESSPENRASPLIPGGRIHNGQSTESLDSLSDEYGSNRPNRQPQNVRSRNNNNPVPPPRKRNEFGHLRRCRALYDCEADNEDELTFEEGDIILVINEETEDENWMEGILESDPAKRGLFPVSFVHMLAD